MSSHKQKNKLVLFHAKWCGHCRTFMKDWKRIEVLVKHHGHLINLQTEAVESDDPGAKERMSKEQITGFPTIKLYLHNKPHMIYQGERSAEALVKWVEEKIHSNDQK
jgi:thiol:disulfide interchange protein